MNRKYYNLYGHAVHQASIVEKSVLPPEPEGDVMESHDPSEPFLRLVYAKDKRSKLPTGDLQYMVSDKANPEVKKWVIENLMMETVSAATPNQLSRGIDDDTILQMVRQPYEDRESYANRVNRFMRENVELYGRLAEQLQKRADEQRSVPTESK